MSYSQEQATAAETLVLPVEGKEFEKPTGICDDLVDEGIIFIANVAPIGVAIETNEIVGVLARGKPQVQRCLGCNRFDVDCALEKEPASLTQFCCLCGSGVSQEPYDESFSSDFGDSSPIQHRSYHILEDPGGIGRMADCDVPTEEYYEALAQDMKVRHPNASKAMLEHVGALEPFLDVSIVAGFSFV